MKKLVFNGFHWTNVLEAESYNLVIHTEAGGVYSTIYLFWITTAIKKTEKVKNKEKTLPCFISGCSFHWFSCVWKENRKHSHRHMWLVMSTRDHICQSVLHEKSLLINTFFLFLQIRFHNHYIKPSSSKSFMSFINFPACIEHVLSCHFQHNHAQFQKTESQRHWIYMIIDRGSSIKHLN